MVSRYHAMRGNVNKMKYPPFWTILLLLLQLTTVTLYSDVPIRTSPVPVKTQTVIAMDTFGDKIAILCSLAGDRNGFTVVLYNGTTWTTIPAYYGVSTSGSDSAIIPFNYSARIKFDRTGNLWLTSDALYQYSSGVWKTYRISDASATQRKYSQVVFDNNNTPWFTAALPANSSSNSAGQAEFWTMQNGQFTRRLHSNSAHSFSLNSFFSTTLHAYEDGRVGLFRKLSKGIDSASEIPYGYLVFSNSTDSVKKYTLRSGDSNIKGYQSFIVNDILSQHDELWFSYGKNLYVRYDSVGNEIYELFNGGVSRLIGDSSWVHWSELGECLSIVPSQNPSSLMYVANTSFVWRITSTLEAQKMPVEEVLARSEFIKLGIDIPDSPVVDLLNRLRKEPVSDEFLTMKRTSDGALYFLSSLGLLKVSEMPLTVTEENTSTHMLFYPNPVTDVLTFSDNVRNLRYKIYDISGRLLSTSTVSASNQIDVRELSQGQYSLELLKNNSLVTFSFIKL